MVIEHAFIAYAESYGRAAYLVAKAVKEGEDLRFKTPIGALALHCIELSLKAVLLKTGKPEEEVRREYGHDLEKLFADTPLDWSNLDMSDIQFLSKAHVSHGLRYRRKDKFFILEAEDLFPIVETVFQRCLAFVLPGATRALFPRA